MERPYHCRHTWDQTKICHGVRGEYKLIDCKLKPSIPDVESGSIIAISIWTGKVVRTINHETKNLEFMRMIPGVYLNIEGAPRRIPRHRVESDERANGIAAEQPTAGWRFHTIGARVLPTRRVRLQMGAALDDFDEESPGE